MLRVNPAVHQAQERLKVADAQAWQATAKAFPTISATATANYKKDALLGGRSLFGGDPYNSYGFGVSASQPIYSGGALTSGWSYSRNEQSLRQVDLRIARRDAAWQTVQAYFALVLAEERLKIMAETVEVQRELVDTVRSRYRIGREQELNFLQASTQLALLQPRLAQARLERDNARLALANLMVRTENAAEVQVTTPLDDPVWETLSLRLQERAPDSFEIQRAKVALDQQQDARDVVLSQNWPQLSAVGTLNTYSTVKSKLFDSEGQSWTVGLQLEIPIFSGMSSVGQRREYSARYSELESQQVQIQNQVALSVAQARDALALTEKVRKPVQKALAQARTAQKLAVRTYRMGTANYQQYFEAERTLLDAELTYAQTEYDFVVNVAALARASSWPPEELLAAMEAAAALSESPKKEQQ